MTAPHPLHLTLPSLFFIFSFFIHIFILSFTPLFHTSSHPKHTFQLKLAVMFFLLCVSFFCLHTVAFFSLCLSVDFWASCKRHCQCLPGGFLAINMIRIQMHPFSQQTECKYLPVISNMPVLLYLNIAVDTFKASLRLVLRSISVI